MYLLTGSESLSLEAHGWTHLAYVVSDHPLLLGLIHVRFTGVMGAVGIQLLPANYDVN